MADPKNFVVKNDSLGLIVEIVSVVSLFNLFNRTANALRIPPTV